MKSEGKHFCAGADVNMMRDAGATSPEENRRDSKRLDTLFNSLWSHPCFTICCVQGVALGGGAGLVSCADHVIAEPGTRIQHSQKEARHTTCRDWPICVQEDRQFPIQAHQCLQAESTQ